MGNAAATLTTTAAPTPNTTPIRPPVTLIRIDSMRNCARMSRLLAPIDIRKPISRVRSVTETYMMFIMPMPPTSSEIPATAASSTVIMSVVEVSIDDSSCCERIEKSSSSSALRRWLVRRMSVISPIASSV